MVISSVKVRVSSRRPARCVHDSGYRLLSRGRYYACEGFSNATRGMIRNPSFEVERTGRLGQQLRLRIAFNRNHRRRLSERLDTTRKLVATILSKLSKSPPEIGSKGMMPAQLTTRSSPLVTATNLRMVSPQPVNRLPRWIVVSSVHFIPDDCKLGLRL